MICKDINYSLLTQSEILRIFAKFYSGAAQNAGEPVGSARLCNKAWRKIRQKMGVER
jgi:hypothetical protein